MIQYIEKLFQETKTIILPELGALTITNPDTKEMMFMPYLKHNDGALAGFIAKEAGIPKPRIYLIPTDNANAFATGRSPNNAVVAVSPTHHQTINNNAYSK